MRGTQLARLEGVADHHARPQVATNQAEQPRIANPSGHPGHQEIVLDVVEEFRQVQIDGNAVARPDVGLYLPERSMGTALWSEAEARLGELRVEDRRHDLRDGLLDKPIEYGRNPQHSLAPSRLGDAHPTNRLWTIGAIEQAAADRRPVLARIAREILDAHPVDTGGTFIGFHLTPRAAHVLRRDHLFHQINVQGWLRVATPRLGSPGRVHRRGRVAHDSSLSIRVRPFTPFAFQRPRLVRPLLTSVRSRSPITRRRAALDRACAAWFARTGRQHPVRLDLDQPVGPAGVPRHDLAPPRRTDLPE